MNKGEVFGLDIRLVLAIAGSGLVGLILVLVFVLSADQRAEIQYLAKQNEELKERVAQLEGNFHQSATRIDSLTLEVRYLRCLVRGGVLDFGTLECREDAPAEGRSPN